MDLKCRIFDCNVHIIFAEKELTSEKCRNTFESSVLLAVECLGVNMHRCLRTFKCTPVDSSLKIDRSQKCTETTRLEDWKQEFN